MRTLLPLLCGPLDFRLNAGLMVACAVLLACIVALASESAALVIAARQGALRSSLFVAAPMVFALALDPLVWQVWSHRYFPPPCVAVGPARWNAFIDAYTHVAIALELGTALAVVLTVIALVVGIRRIARARGGQMQASAAL